MITHTTCYTHQRDPKHPRERCETCNRLKLERRIVLRTARALIKAGYSIAVNDGEDTTTPYTREMATITEALFTTDEDYLLTDKPDASPRRSFVYMVYGNSGHDVICDYGVSLEAVMQPINDYCDTIATDGKHRTSQQTE